MFQPRPWQKQFVEDYLKKNLKDYLLVATPGAGKTKGSFHCNQHYHGDETDKLIVVAPTKYLKEQWAGAAVTFGMQLNPYWKRGLINRDFDGICVTYSQAASNAEMLDYLCERHKVFVIFDEIHHAGDSRNWGDGIKSAFEKARRRLALSGTPFRTDNNYIPFVKYVDNKSQADFTYGYGHSLVDEVCRNVGFPLWDGEASWFDGEDVIEASSFDDILDEKHESQRLRVVLDPKNSYMEMMLKKADSELTNMRIEDKNAGGLIVCIDTNHANAISRVLTKICGQAPTIVHSDIEGDSIALIKRFREDTSKRWLVAVKMVSEGVDIERLRVGVYATNVITELFFRQFVGRFVRRQGEDDVWSIVFVPKDQRLVAFTEEIKEERDHAIREARYREIEKSSERTRIEAPDFYSISADPNESGHQFVADGSTFEQSTVETVTKRLEKFGIKLEPAKAVLLYREFGQPGEVAIQVAPTPIKPIWSDKKKLGKKVNGAAYGLAVRIKEALGTSKTERDIVARIHGQWQKLGNSKQADATMEELEEKLAWILKLGPDDYWRFLR